MITISGVHVFPDGQGAPSLRDIAYSLGRVPRFGGHTTLFWPVLCHSIVCLRIAKHLGYKARLQLLTLLHDAHEAAGFEDISSAWKTDDTRRLQAKMDSRIWRSLGIRHPTLREDADVSVVDKLAFQAECWEVGPPGIREYYHIVVEPEYAKEVREVRESFPEPSTTNGFDSPGVKAFVTIANNLRMQCQSSRVLEIEKPESSS